MKLVASLVTAFAASQLTCVYAVAAPIVKPATPAKTPQNSSSPGWTLEQKSQLCGDMHVSMSAKGINVRSTKGSISMVSLAPFKEVTVYNIETKRYCIEPLDTFRCPGNKTMAVVNGGLLRDVLLTQTADKAWRGHQVHTYISTSAFDQKQQLRYNNHEIPGRAVKKLDIYTSDDFKNDARANEAICRFFGLPKVTGFPLMVHYLDFTYENSSIKNVETIKMTAGPVADSAFVLPPNLVKVDKQGEVFVGDATNDAIQMMVGQ